MNVIPNHSYLEPAAVTRGEEARFSLQSILAVGWRRRGTLLGSILACLIVAAIYLVNAADVFTAKAMLMMDTKQRPPSPSQVSTELLTDPAVIESQLEIVKSPQIMAKVVDTLHLDADPEFAGGGPGMLSSISRWLGGAPAVRPTDAERRTAATSALLQKAKITRTGHSYLAEIAVTTRDAKKSARIANAVAEAYIKDQLDASLASNLSTVAWMGERVQDVERQADKAAAAVESFRRSHEQDLARNDAAARARLDELSAAAASARTDYEALRTRAVRFTQFIQEQSLPMTEARLAAAADPPQYRSWPKASLVVLLAGVVGLLGGVGLSWLRESLDHRLRSGRQIVHDLGLPLAGLLPLVRGQPSWKKRVSANLFDSAKPWCAGTEALRAVKVAVDHSARQMGAAVIGVASARPGEGKSTVVVNLARMLCEMDYKVLVIDADFKKPDISTALSTPSANGLSNLMGASADIQACLHATPAGFDLLACGDGRRPRHPFDLLGSQRMLDLLTAVRQNYHYLLIDLPSIQAAIDAHAIAQMVDGFLLVVEYGRTTADEVSEALAASEAVASGVVTTVFNKSPRLTRRNRHRVPRRLSVRVGSYA